MDRVDNDVLREAFLRSRRTPNSVAVQMGWMRTKRAGARRVIRGDGTRVLRALGIKGTATRGHHYPQRTLAYEDAVRMTEILGLDPWEAGV
jgi:hypothetical protein